MKPLTEFYSGLHSTQKDYSAGTYDIPALLASAPWKGWVEGKTHGPLAMLDVGCGKGLFLRDVVRGLKDRWSIVPTRLTGVDLVRSPANLFLEISPSFEFIQHDTDGNPLPFPDATFDFLSCNHVLEHVFETEKLVQEFRRVLKPDGFCIISVPNLAAWMNRVALLFAGQPLGTEVGTQSITYGFWPRHFQAHLAQFPPSGHIRDFTPRSLRDLTQACGFKTRGWWKQSHGFAAALSKWGGRNIAILLEPALESRR